jgi:hypothetical protein
LPRTKSASARSPAPAPRNGNRALLSQWCSYGRYRQDHDQRHASRG